MWRDVDLLIRVAAQHPNHVVALHTYDLPQTPPKGAAVLISGGDRRMTGTDEADLKDPTALEMALFSAR